ncbi:hypothetical protein Tco_0513466 [Tanacetum coccineum]
MVLRVFIVAAGVGADGVSSDATDAKLNLHLRGTFMPPSNKPDIDDTQFTYGSKSNNYSESNSVSNDFVSCDKLSAKS